MEPLDIGELEKRIREQEIAALLAYQKGKADAPILYKPTGYAKASPKIDSESPMIFVASEESQDRMGDLIKADGWETKEFQKNPVILFSHDHNIAPIGRSTKVWAENKQLLSVIEFDEGDQFANFIARKYRRGFMRAVSVGFRPLEFEENMREGNGHDFPGYVFKRQELLEISAVSVPAHPAALRKAMDGKPFILVVPEELKVAMAQAPEDKGVIGYKKTPAAPRDPEWDAAAEVAAASVDDLKGMCAWVDSANADNKTAYKFPHHKAAGDHSVVFRACAAGIGVLNGGRGGADIPAGDRQGVYNHLARHIRDDFDAEAPPLKSYEPDQKDYHKYGAALKRIIDDIESLHQQMMDDQGDVNDSIESGVEKQENGGLTAEQRQELLAKLRKVYGAEGET